MTELFSNLSEEFKIRAQMMIDLAVSQKSIITALSMIQNFSKECSQEEQEFHDGTAYFAIQGDAPVYFYYMMKPWRPFRINHIMIDKPIYHRDIFTPEELKDKATIAKYTEVLKARYFDLEKEGQKYVKKSQKIAKK